LSCEIVLNWEKRVDESFIFRYFPKDFILKPCFGRAGEWVVERVLQPGLPVDVSDG